MPAEIERKFLAATLPDPATMRAGKRTEQGYAASGERTEVRLRRAGGRMTLTAKRAEGEPVAELDVYDGTIPPTLTRAWRRTASRATTATATNRSGG